MSFARFNVVTDDDLHASLAHVRKIGSPILASVKTEGGSSSGVFPQPPSPHAGAAAARPFNLDACFNSLGVPANAEGEGFEG